MFGPRFPICFPISLIDVPAFHSAGRGVSDALSLFCPLDLIAFVRQQLDEILSRTRRHRVFYGNHHLQFPTLVLVHGGTELLTMLGRVGW